jgi:phage repressor protein C with HTH and peptisase S24 domain
MEIKDRIIELINYFSNGNKKAFAELVGIAPTVIENIVGKREGKPSFDVLQKILFAFAKVNSEWLITNKGDMLKGENNISERSVMFKDTIPDNYMMVPVYNFDAVGGMSQSTEITDSPAYIERHIPFVDAKEGDICIHVTGNSMTPAYSPGSILLIRKVVGWNEYFGYGNCFVLFLQDGRRILKEVQKSEIDPTTHVLCVSYNEKNPSEELSRKFIVDVYKVIMVLTYEGF